MSRAVSGASRAISALKRASQVQVYGALLGALRNDWVRALTLLQRMREKQVAGAERAFLKHFVAKTYGFPRFSMVFHGSKALRAAFAVRS